jgi:type II secretory pathway pseudopilin PulG
MLHQRKAFTLLELMVALINMAIPSAIVVPSLLGVVANAQIAANSSTALDLADSVYDRTAQLMRWSRPRLRSTKQRSPQKVGQRELHVASS